MITIYGILGVLVIVGVLLEGIVSIIGLVMEVRSCTSTRRELSRCEHVERYLEDFRKSIAEGAKRAPQNIVEGRGQRRKRGSK